jgi:hypothetical protein
MISSVRYLGITHVLFFFIFFVSPSPPVSSLSSSLSFAAQYQDTEVPQARFSYDLSPMSVTIVRQSKTFVTFVTSLCAIIGGTYTVLGLVSGFMNVIFKPKKI